MTTIANQGSPSFNYSCGDVGNQLRAARLALRPTNGLGEKLSDSSTPPDFFNSGRYHLLDSALKASSGIPSDQE